MNVLSRRAVLTGCTSVIAASVTGCLGKGIDEWVINEILSVASATQYQEPRCDCCSVYADYLQGHLDGDLQVIVSNELTAVKEDFGIPSDLWSCHTVELDGYIVEGHMPVEVIATLLDEEPDIEGIALPGMPAGSPGMGGKKDETWRIYGIQTKEEPVVYAEI